MLQDRARATEQSRAGGCGGGSTCAGSNEKSVNSESLVMRRQLCQHPMQLAGASQGPRWESEALRAEGVRYSILCFSISMSVKVNHQPLHPVPCRRVCVGHFFSHVDFSRCRPWCNFWKHISDVTKTATRSSLYHAGTNAPPQQMGFYPCRCELIDGCFGMLREAVSQFSVEVMVHHTNPR